MISSPARPGGVSRPSGVFITTRRPERSVGGGAIAVGQSASGRSTIAHAPTGVGYARVGVGNGGRVVSGRGGLVSAERFYAPGMDRRIVYPGVAVPRAAGLRIGLARPVYYRGRQVVAHVPHCGFGFFTPVVPVPYPVPVYEPYPVPVYTSTTVVTPPPVYQSEVYAPPAGYADGGYGYAGGGYADGAYANGAYEAGAYSQEPAYAAAPAGLPTAPPADDRVYTQEQPIQPPPADIPAQEAPESAAPEALPGDSADDQLTQAERQMVEGMKAFSAGDYDQAARTFLQAGMGDNDNIDAWLAYAVARFATGDYKASALAVRRAIRAFPDVVNSPVDIRERYGRPEDFDRHLAAAEERVRNRAEDGDALLTLGFVQHFSRQREAAAQTFEMLCRRFEADRELADIFLNARPLEEIDREMQEMYEGQSNGNPGQAPAVDPSGSAAPPPPPPPVGGQSGYDPVGSALRSEQNLRNAGLTR